MKSYDIQKDCLLIREMLGMSQKEFADAIGVSFATINRIENNKHTPSDFVVERIYDLAYENKIRINSVISDIFIETSKNVYFHGAKGDIENEVDLFHSEEKIDFGVGFYLGESYKQASSFVASSKKGSVYVFNFAHSKLNILKFDVDVDWMFAICYYRNTLKEEHRNSKMVQEIVKRVESADLIIAPIADNSMYDIMTQFANGQLTDIQASHCLSASNLGMQYVIKKDSALKHLKPVARLYLCEKEKKDILLAKLQEDMISKTKVDASRIKYRRKGKYIEELLGC